MKSFSSRLGFSIALIIILTRVVQPQVNDPSLLAFSGSYFDFNKKVNTAAELRAEFRYKKGWEMLKPFGGIMVTTDGGAYFFAGGLINFFIGEHFVITPSFAPGLYYKGSGKDLYFPLEFRSQIEIAFRFTNGARIGMSLGHMSNASLGPPNPGVETLAGTIAFPIY